jgi:beta-glucosidase
LLLLSAAHGLTQTYLDPTASIEARVQDLLDRMTLDEKVGQMTQADRGHLVSTEDIKAYFLGSLLSGGGSAPAENSPQGWADMYDDFQVKALETRLKIPLLYGIDAVHGHNNVYGAVIFPHNIGMGCTWNTDLIREAARITALEVAGTGIDWTFAPCIAVPRDERWGRTYEGFGETAEITELMSEASVLGFQGDSLSDPKTIVACAKHFIGDGGTTGGDDQGNTEVDESTLRAIHLPGYIAAIDVGVGTVMATYNSWNGQKVHGSRYLLTDLLKDELGFGGFVVSDWNAINQLPGDYTSDVKESVTAGIDMAMAPDQYRTFFTTLKSLVQQGEIPVSRIDDAVSRILRVKFQMGLFERPFTDRSLTDSVGRTEHRLIARQCVRESMVLLKKENGVLPLNKSAGKILVAGSKADNLGYQCGGWTISWQGGSGDITQGTTILSAVQNAVNGASVVFSPDGSGVDDADVAVVVVGEQPYAEGTGDRSDLRLSPQDIETVRTIKDNGIPTVVVLISGRPMILDNLIHYADVLFVAWLPGTEGDGVADVLFGDYPPSGRLTHSWPRSMSQIPINWGDTNYDPLYPYKHGIDNLDDYGPDEAPLFHSAVLLKSGTAIEAAFSKSMAEPEESSGFQVSVNGNAAGIGEVRVKSSDPHTLEIDLANEVNAGDSVMLTYTPGSITDTDGISPGSFGPEEVYNLRNEGSGAHTIPGRVEAENYASMFGVQIEPTTDIGGGSNVGYIDATDWMKYNLVVPDSGDYQVDLRVAAEFQSARIGLISGGKVLKTLDLPVTGGWQIWETVRTEIPLDGGEQELMLFAFIGGFNLNWMDFTFLTSVLSTSENPYQFHLDRNYPNPFNASTTIAYSIPERSMVTLIVYDTRGREKERLVHEVQDAGSKKVIWNAEDAASGLYVLRLTAGRHHTAVRKIVLLK